MLFQLGHLLLDLLALALQDLEVEGLRQLAQEISLQARLPLALGLQFVHRIANDKQPQRRPDG